ncbi:MAG: hypothetical protein WCS15_00205 [Prevotella sp.]
MDVALSNNTWFSEATPIATKNRVRIAPKIEKRRILIETNTADTSGFDSYEVARRWWTV